MMSLQNILRWRPHQGALAYCVGTLAFDLLHPVLMFYYVNVFLDVYHVSEWWFQTAQAIYLIWNAINDPLLGYIQDNYNWSIFRKRRLAVYYGAPFFAIFFMMFWIPWQDYQPGNWLSGLHLLVALFLYDLMFTFIGLGQCCLLTEMAESPEDRFRMIQYSRTASIAGSLGVLFCEKASSGLKSFRSFQVACAFLSVIAYFCLLYMGKNAHTTYEKQIDGSEVSGVKTEHLLTDRDSGLSIFRLTWQVLSQWNFIFCVIANFGGEYHTTFVSSFVRIFCENLLPDAAVRPEAREWFYGAIMIMPQILIILGIPFMAKIGYYKVIKFSFVFKIMCAGVMSAIGPSRPFAYMVFILFDRVLNTVSYELVSLAAADIVDENMALYGHNHPMSSTVFGTNALVIKPAQSLAPMITVRVLHAYGYEDHQSAAAAPQALRDVMFVLSCWTPIVLGVVQYAMWTRYTIRDSHRRISK